MATTYQGQLATNIYGKECGLSSNLHSFSNSTTVVVSCLNRNFDSTTKIGGEIWLNRPASIFFPKMVKPSTNHTQKILLPAMQRMSIKAARPAIAGDAPSLCCSSWLPTTRAESTHHSMHQRLWQPRTRKNQQPNQALRLRRYIVKHQGCWLDPHNRGAILVKPFHWGASFHLKPPTKTKKTRAACIYTKSDSKQGSFHTSSPVRRCKGQVQTM